MKDVQAAVKALSREDAANYDKMKVAIVDGYTITPERHCQKFRAVLWQAGDRPSVIATHLKDSATLWLQPRMVEA